jgi:hypothetical protein
MTNIKLWHEPSNPEDAMMLARTIAASGIAPKSLQRPEAIFTAIAYGTELGLSPMASLRGINVINGVPSSGADMMVGLVLQRGNVTMWDYSAMSNERCELTAQRGDGKPLTIEWTIEQAHGVIQYAKGVKVRLTDKDTWKGFPRQMLKHRVDAEMCRALWPDIVHGLYTPDEAEGIRVNVTPIQPAAQVLPSLPAIKATPAAIAEEPIETTEPLSNIPGFGKSSQQRAREAGCHTPEELHRDMCKGLRIPKMRVESVNYLKERFGPFDQADAPDKYETALRDLGDDDVPAWMDCIVGDLTDRNIAVDSDDADAMFHDGLKAAGLVPSQCTLEQAAGVWRSLVEG